MGWTDPAAHVFAVGEIVTAATLNTYVKDNLIDLDRRVSPSAQWIGTDESTASVGYTNLATAGPAVTVVLGSGSSARCIVSLYSAIYNATANCISAMSYALSGASTRAAGDSTAIGFAPSGAGGAYGCRIGGTFPDFLGVTGSLTVTAKYAALGGGTAHFADRRLIVTPLGS